MWFLFYSLLSFLRFVQVNKSSSEVISRGDHWCRRELSAVFYYLLINFLFKFWVPVVFVVPKETPEKCHSSPSSDTMLHSTEEGYKTLHQGYTRRTYSQTTVTNNWTCWKDEANLVFRLVTPEGKICLPCLLGITLLVPWEKKSAVLHGLIINPSLTKLFRWRWLDVSFILFLAFLVSGKKQKNKTEQNKNEANIKPPWLHLWLITHTTYQNWVHSTWQV